MRRCCFLEPAIKKARVRLQKSFNPRNCDDPVSYSPEYTTFEPIGKVK